MPPKRAKDTKTADTLPTQFRLSRETRAQLDAIAAAYCLPTRTAVVQFLANREAKKIQK